jgi:hypothetical protein
VFVQGSHSSDIDPEVAKAIDDRAIKHQPSEQEAAPSEEQPEHPGCTTMSIFVRHGRPARFR